MKKIIMTAAIALASLAVNAQSAHVDIPVTVNILDIITMSRLDGLTPSATFVDANHLDWGMWLSNGVYGFYKFKVRSNRHFNVTTSIGSFTFASATGVDYNPTYDVNHNMTYGDFDYQLTTTAGGAPINAPSGAVPNASSLTNFQAYAAGENPVFQHANNGGDQEWCMMFLANPLWNYTGGTYGATITVTATQ